MRWDNFAKFTITAVIILVGFVLYAMPLANSVKQGLDLQGGTHIVLEAEDTPEAKVTDDAVNRVVKIGRAHV